MAADLRPNLLRLWVQRVTEAATAGAITGKPVQFQRSSEIVAGPRAGAILLYAGLQAGLLLKALNANDQALLRQFIPWTFTEKPQCFMSGQAVRLEMAWPSGLERSMIRLSEMNQHPAGDGRFVAGLDEYGRTVLIRLSDGAPHVLIAGHTRSGKSVAMRNAVLQLGRDVANQLVLCDGKRGEGLGRLDKFAAGPVARDADTIRNALGWAAAQMLARYDRMASDGAATWTGGRLVIAFDEFQAYTDDRAIAGLMAKIAAQGAAARVHLLAATQHPAVGAFGYATTGRNMVVRAALRVGDYKASEAAVGAPDPRADRLLGAGDTYLVGPGSISRLQGAYVDQADIDAQSPRARDIVEWPPFDPEQVGREIPPGPGRPVKIFSDEQILVAMVSAKLGEGRGRVIARLKRHELDVPHTDRLRGLMAEGRKMRDRLDSLVEWEITADAVSEEETD